ncbi:hypothetical protein [Emticicia fluvialis]|uniref:hypothetical protein n=1 Tax=Emticicia fluvialis TaxID=2974474 RepID=UPI0021662E6B|nr:hypothetical protein [Emticicia fluvialis]
MKTTKAAALRTLLTLFPLIIAFHVSVMADVIPYTIVWAGRIHSTQEMYVFEVVSIVINLLFITVLLLKAQYVKNNVPDRLLNNILWLFLILFSVNTIGNLMAKTSFEKYVFTPITLLSAILIWLVVRKEKA